MSVPALAAGLAALADTAHQAATRTHNDIWLPWLGQALAADPALLVRPSQANFLLVDFPDAAAAQGCTAHLAEAGILVRRFGPGAHAHQVRISIGNAAALQQAAALIIAYPKQGARS